MFKRSSTPFAAAEIPAFFAIPQVRSTLDQLKRAVGYRAPGGLLAPGRIKSIFPNLGRGERINRLGLVPLQGFSSSIRTTPGVLATTDFLSSGQYNFDYIVIRNAATEFAVFEVVDTAGVIYLTFSVVTGASVGSNADLITDWQHLTIPIAQGQKVQIRCNATAGAGIQAALTWQYVSAYNSNDPLSLAALSVQKTEPQTAGQTTVTPEFSVPAPSSFSGPDAYTAMVIANQTAYVGGDGGGDGGGGGGGGDE